MGVGGQRHALGAFTSGKTRHPLLIYRRQGGLRNRCRVRKIPPPHHRDKEGGNDLIINRAAVGRKRFWIDEKKSPALGIRKICPTVSATKRKRLTTSIMDSLLLNFHISLR
jgi:hypothetical protein